MSLAVTVSGGIDTGASRITLLAGAATAGSLGMSAAEQWREGLTMRHWSLPLIAGLVCAFWSLLVAWRDRRLPVRTLAIDGDGGLRLIDPHGGAPIEAFAIVAWRLGAVFFLHARATKKVACALPAADGPQSESEAGAADVQAPRGLDYRLLLVRRRVPDADWHGLCRWLVWYRRSGRGKPPQSSDVRNSSQPV